MTDKDVLDKKHGEGHGYNHKFIEKNADEFIGLIFTKTIDSSNKATYTVVPDKLYITRTDLKVEGDLVVPEEKTLVICSKLIVTGAVTINGRIRLEYSPGRKQTSEGAFTTRKKQDIRIFPIFEYGEMIGDDIKRSASVNARVKYDSNVVRISVINSNKRVSYANSEVTAANAAVADVSNIVLHNVYKADAVNAAVAYRNAANAADAAVAYRNAVNAAVAYRNAANAAVAYRNAALISYEFACKFQTAAIQWQYDFDNRKHYYDHTKLESAILTNKHDKSSVVTRGLCIKAADSYRTAYNKAIALVT